jgi:hypothetical protein
MLRHTCRRDFFILPPGHPLINRNSSHACCTVHSNGGATRGSSLVGRPGSQKPTVDIPGARPRSTYAPSSIGQSWDKKGQGSGQQIPNPWLPSPRRRASSLLPPLRLLFRRPAVAPPLSARLSRLLSRPAQFCSFSRPAVAH